MNNKQLSREINLASDAIGNAISEIKSLEDKIQLLEGFKDKLENQLEKANEKITELEGMHERLSMENNSIKKQLKDAENQIWDLETKIINITN